MRGVGNLSLLKSVTVLIMISSLLGTWDGKMSLVKSTCIYWRLFGESCTS